ncbi:hypothetical protein K1719_021139, partial [Acacia pycnantha]
MLETCWLAKLRMVEINSCQVTHVTWLKYAPLLQRLAIYGCKSMEEVIKEEEAIKDENVDSSLVFSSLVQLILLQLPILKSIHRAPLPFPSLKSVVISGCPKLEVLPFDFNSAKHKLTLIRGRQNWWDNLKWNDPTAKHNFQSKFKRPLSDDGGEAGDVGVHELRNGFRLLMDREKEEIKDIEVQGVQAIQNKCLSRWCSKNCLSNYKLGKNVAKVLKGVDELATEGKSFGKDFIFAHEAPPKAIEM